MYIPAYQWFWTSAVGVGQRSAWAPLSGGLGLPRNVVVGFGTKVLWKQRKQREISGVRCWLNHQNGNRMGIWGLMMGCIMDLKNGKLSLGLGPRHVSLPEAICQAHVDQLISGISPVMYIQYTIIYIYIHIHLHTYVYIYICGMFSSYGILTSFWVRPYGEFRKIWEWLRSSPAVNWNRHGFFGDGMCLPHV